MLTGTGWHIHFRKSSYSTTAQECVEVAEYLHGAAVRDTQNKENGHLEYPAEGWVALISSLRL